MDIKLDEEDKEALLDALSGHAKPSLLTRIMDRVLKRSAAPNADLNGDGAVNLVDLQYYASAIANKDVHKEASQQVPCQPPSAATWFCKQ